jgi:N-acetyl-anhydromuramyl-L-alanine amidase AmpD
MEKIELSDIVQVDFPENQYYREETEKKQIVLHHTVSSGKVDGTINWWKQDPQRVATQFIVDATGVVYQLYSSKFWAHHLGIKSDFIKKYGFLDYGTRNTKLNKESIGIEISRWGGLLKDSKGYHPTYWDTTLKKEVCQTKITIPNENVQVFEKPFRGYYFFEKYTNEQIISVGKLVTYLCEKWGISLDYDSSIWDVNKNALGSVPGIYTHVSYRSDKSDLMPQPEMIEMLKSLKKN